MAYDTTKQRPSDTQKPDYGENNPYTQLVEGSPVTAPSSEAMPGASGPSATGHVNFDQIYNANAGVAAREAGKLQTSAVKKGFQAQQGLAGAQGQFNNAVRTGTVQGPSEQQQTWAKYGLKTGAEVAPASPAAGQAVYNPPPDEAAVKAGVQKGAAGSYGGPSALSDMEPYSKLAQDTADAQDEATALGNGNQGIQATGMGQLDAALLGASGRKGFEELGQRYGGLKNQLEQANVASRSTADAARKQSDDAAAAYKALLDEDQARESAPVDDGSIHLDAAPGVGGSDATLGTDGSNFSSADYGQMYQDMGFKTDSDGRFADPDEKAAWQDVWAGLTERERAQVMGMNAAERKAWWEQHKPEA